jgi:hypothetical protein
MFCKNDSRIQEVLPTRGQIARGGSPPFANPGLQEIIFMDSRSSCGEDRLDASGAFKRAFCWGIVGIRRGKIVDCGGCLSFGSVGWQVSAKEKGRGIRPRDPWFALVSLLVSVDNQK